MRAIYLLIYSLISYSLGAQSPVVPTRIDFAGMKLRLTEDARSEIQEHVNQLTRSPKYHGQKAELARSYFPIIERVFREENLPDDFKFLVLQESALVSDAVSTSNAVGFWQFKDFTAMEMGLRVDKQVDERMNIVASSRAAARYLKKNNEIFDNWIYALQSYQMGAGGAMRVVDDKNYGVRSMTIDKKTYWYVKKYLAHKIAYEGHVSGVAQLRFEEYTDGAGKDIKDISKETGLDEQLLADYNKWLRKGKIPEDKAYTVILPLEGDTKYVSKAPEEVQKKIVTQIEYNIGDESLFPKIKMRNNTNGGMAEINGIKGIVAAKDDKLVDLARKGGVGLSKFLKYNEISIDHKVKEGQFYYLRKKRSKAGTHYHVLQPDEDLWHVSQKYGLRLKKLMVKNRIRDDKDMVLEGRVLWLRFVRPSNVNIEYRPVDEPEMEKPVAQPVEMITKVNEPDLPEETDVSKETDEQQDSLSLEVKPEEVPLDSMMDEAEITKDIDVKEDSMPEVTVILDSVKRVHQIEPGETFYSISKLYNVSIRDLLAWNDLQINDKLSIGQKLMVYVLEPVKEDIKEGNPFVYHTVQPGDTLYKIAKTYDTTIQEILELNNRKDFSISLGEKIIVSKRDFSN